MALFPDLGSWLLRSVRRDDLPDSPVFAIERLNTLPRPLQDADKDTLVGAVLTMSSSLQLALEMMLELLPQEKSRDRLGEVLCPTLGHLLASLQSTLFSFEQVSTVPTQLPTDGLIKTPPEPPTTPVPDDPRRHQPPHLAAARHEPPVLTRPSPGCSPTSSPRRAEESQPITEKFPPLQDSSTPRQRHVEAQDSQQTGLVKALQAEMRVQAAIHVAVESLEFAEGQLKLVKEINGLHGGSTWPFLVLMRTCPLFLKCPGSQLTMHIADGTGFDIVQKHFYEGYNRLLFRALDLERRECGSLPARSNQMSTLYAQEEQQQLPNGLRGCRPSPKRRQSVSFQHTLPTPPPTAVPRPTPVQTPYLDQRPLARRNTIQGIRQEGERLFTAYLCCNEDGAKQKTDPSTLGTRPTLKRRLSLAEELAMVGEDSESGYQDETSEMASSESEESDSESCNDSLDVMAREGESEGYSANGESAGETSTTDSENDDDGEDDGHREEMTIDAREFINGGHQCAITSTDKLPSRLPRLKQPLT